jgi:aspartyl-tRNA(Asn)/glutamyl-tRNA(Gln) amidotransferase subunit B
VAQGAINLGTAREAVFPALLAGEGSAAEIVARKGLAQVADPGAIAERVRAVVSAHPEVVAQIRAGRANLKGFLVGQVLKAGGGRLDPRGVNEALDDLLAKP